MVNGDKYGPIGDVIVSWGGGTVDPERKELLLCLNGGHTNYLGNESYALQFNIPNGPAWKRLCDPTPMAPTAEYPGIYGALDVSRNFLTGGSFNPATDIPAVHLDGRPRASHTSGNYQFAYDNAGEGRAWFILQTSVSEDSGASAQGIVSFNRSAVAALPGDFAPYSTLNPYQIHGIVGLTGTTANFHFGPSAYDPVTGNVWGYGNTRAWAFNVNTKNLSFVSFSTGATLGSLGYKGAWAVCLPDLRKVFIGATRTAGQPVWVHDLTNNTFTRYFTTPSLQWDPDSYFDNYANPGVPNGGWNGGGNNYSTVPYMFDQFIYGMGAVYTNGLVYVGPVPARLGGTLGGQIRVLNPAQMLAGANCWTELPNSGMRPVAMNNPLSLDGDGGKQNGNFQRFNLIDFESEKILIHAADAYGPAHAWRMAPMLTRTFGHYAAFEGSRNGLDPTFSNAKKPGIVGVQLRYYWKDLEPTPDNYNFSQIITDLDNARKQGLRVVVMIVDKSFNTDVLVPPYLASYTSPNPNGVANGTSLHRWKTYPRDRLVALLQALAAQVNGHLALEAVALQETSIGISTADLRTQGYTKEAYRDSYKVVLSAACNAFSNHCIFWYMNYIASTPTATGSGSGGQAMIGEIIDYMLANNYDNFSFGGPDILPNGGPDGTPSNPGNLLTVTYPYYSTYNGQVRMFCSNQNDSYRSIKVESPLTYHTMEEMLDWGVTNLHINYCMWNYRAAASPAGSNNYADALVAIAARPNFGPP
jgi:hypothetical protein